MNAFDEAIESVRSGRAAFIYLKNGVIEGEASGLGVKPILLFYDYDKDALKGAEVVDKVVGKAAALLFCLIGVKVVFGLTMSRSAYDYLKKIGIDASYGILVEMIENREGTGMCPLESAVKDIDDPEKGLLAIREAIKLLMAKKSS